MSEDDLALTVVGTPDCICQLFFPDARGVRARAGGFFAVNHGDKENCPRANQHYQQTCYCI